MKRYGPFLIAALAGLICLGGCESAPQPPSAGTTALTSDPRSRELYLTLIAEMNSDGEYYAAIAHIDEFERLYGNAARAEMLRGDALIGLGDLAKAEAAYDSIPHDSLPGDKQYGLGRVAAARSDWKKAAAYLEDAAAAQPTNVRFLDDLGCALFRLGETDDALFALHKAHELAPADAEVSRNLSIALAGKSGGASATKPEAIATAANPPGAQPP